MYIYRTANIKNSHEGQKYIYFSALFHGTACIIIVAVSTATIEYSCLSVCLSVYTITKKIMVQLT